MPDRAPNLEDAIAEGRKELRYRAKVFPRLISTGAIHQNKTNFHNTTLQVLIACAEEKLAADPNAGGRLF
ncbi:hypothetical protein EBR96_08890 [bacterium]|nr:hypothetical protein [bacterium]